MTPQDALPEPKPEPAEKVGCGRVCMPMWKDIVQCGDDYYGAPYLCDECRAAIDASRPLSGESGG